MSFKDLFSETSNDYAAYRPDYPAALFSYLADIVPEHHLAWDGGTGNGQAAVAIANYFTTVIASDASAKQIQAATVKANVNYRVMPAENTDLANESVNLVTVAQALHWFKFDAFYQEVNRVLEPNGVLAAWCYDLLNTGDSKLDEIIYDLYFNILNDYWAPERKYIDKKYQTIPFPYSQLKTPKFFIEKMWNLVQLIHYINTWSALTSYTKSNKHSPLDIIIDKLQQTWGNPQQTRLIRWPIYLLAGRKSNGKHIVFC